jgi:hypothetical protein
MDDKIQALQASSMVSSAVSSNHDTPITAAMADTTVVVEAWPGSSDYSNIRAGRAGINYIHLWRQKLQSVNSPFRIDYSTLDLNLCSVKFRGSTTKLLQIDVRDAVRVKLLYLIFRLHCDNNMQLFLDTYCQHMQSVDPSIATPE